MNNNTNEKSKKSSSNSNTANNNNANEKSKNSTSNSNLNSNPNSYSRTDERAEAERLTRPGKMRKSQGMPMVHKRLEDLNFMLSPTQLDTG